jgi:hypothetical protein
MATPGPMSGRDAHRAIIPCGVANGSNRMSGEPKQTLIFDRRSDAVDAIRPSRNCLRLPQLSPHFSSQAICNLRYVS